MSPLDRHERVIRSLSDDLRPVHRLASPVLRSCLWVLAVAMLGFVLYQTSHHFQLGRAESVTAYQWMALLGSSGTAVLAAVAAFELVLPDRKVQWTLLPIPAVLLWLLSSGLGCLGTLSASDSWGQSFPEARQCLLFIAGISIPLLILLFTMLRRTYVLRPAPVATMAGLASAAASATLLTLVHPHNSALLDVIAHVIAIGFVLVASTLVGGRFLQRNFLART
jgi:hypothetical protein